MLIKTIQEKIPDIEQRNMQMSLHGLLYSLLSESPYSEVIFMAADLLSSQLLGVYLEQLRPDNILVSTELDDTMDFLSDAFNKMLKDYLDMLNKELPRQFTIMIFPYRMIEANPGIWLGHMNNMLAYKGRIILYDCPAGLITPDDLVLITNHAISEENTIKMLQTNKEFVPGNIDKALESRVRKLYEDIVDLIDNDIDEAGIDRLIKDAWTIEKETLVYKDELRNNDIKYHLNEIKNALLELRYAAKADKDFFIEALKKEIDIIPSLFNYSFK
jgi:hypothetical protein